MSPYSEMTRFALGGSGSVRWGRIVGKCQSCGKEVRSRTTWVEPDGRRFHTRDGGVVEPFPEKADPCTCPPKTWKNVNNRMLLEPCPATCACKVHKCVEKGGA